MTLVSRLAEHVVEHHPGRAVTALERLGQDEIVELLAQGPVESASTIVRRLSPQYATAVLRRCDPARVAKMLDELPNDAAVRLIRRVDAPIQDAVIAAMQPRIAKNVRAVLRFPEGTAGALMDPEVLALPQELSARDAVRRIRATPEAARYNLYLIDQDQRLVGALSLRELLIARGQTPLSDLMNRGPHRLRCDAGRAAVVAHPGWREVHALPVVDAEDAYLGAIRYRTLRELEQDLLAPRGQDTDAGQALGEVIAAGARGVLGAFTAAHLEAREGAHD